MQDTCLHASIAPLQLPFDPHSPGYAADMQIKDPPLFRSQLLSRRPAHWNTGTSGGHLYCPGRRSVRRRTMDHAHVAVVSEEAWPRHDVGRELEHRRDI